MRVLLVDNYDSFTGNLAQLIGEVTGDWPDIVRNDEPIPGWRPDRIVLSPGPGSPTRAADIGICRALIREYDGPILGVCLGHQAIGVEFGAPVVHAPKPVHGKHSKIMHDGSGIFAGIPDGFRAVRYHSLILAELPPGLRVTATTSDGLIMGLQHRERPLYGVQFHPESIETDHGGRLIANFLCA